jgi:hypothetical protein
MPNVISPLYTQDHREGPKEKDQSFQRSWPKTQDAGSSRVFGEYNRAQQSSPIFSCLYLSLRERERERSMISIDRRSRPSLLFKLSPHHRREEKQRKNQENKNQNKHIKYQLATALYPGDLFFPPSVLWFPWTKKLANELSQPILFWHGSRQQIKIKNNQNSRFLNWQQDDEDGYYVLRTAWSLSVLLSATNEIRSRTL